MKSQLSRTQFYYKLESNVLEGYPSLKGTPISFDNIFHSKEKYFFGRFDENRFRLTKNCSILDLTEFIIDGKYVTRNDNFSAEVLYRIKPMWFPYLWFRIGIFIMAFVITTAVIPNAENGVSYTGAAILWSLVSLLVTFFFFLSIRRKRRLEAKFRKTFLICE